MKKILQISDIHIGPSEEPARGIDVRANFLNCLREGLSHEPDALIITGDLCLQEGNFETYRWIREQIETTGIPWYVIPGNHDDSHIMSRAFSLEEHFHPEESEFYQTFEWEQRPVFLLDTARGDLSGVQRKWLEGELQRIPSSIEPLIFMHHPPMPLSVPYMDELDIPSPDTRQFLETIRKCPAEVHVFVGHYHVDKNLRADHLTVWTCPSTFYQMSQKADQFGIGDTRPGYRIIDIYPDRLFVGSHYATG